MSAIRKLPDATTLVRLRRNGWTLDQIAEEYGVTRTAVWKALERSGNTNPLPSYKDLVPWKVEQEHRGTAAMARIRSLVKQQQGVPLREGEAKLLKEWLAGMEDAGVILNYHPEAPSNAASTKGGFYFSPRQLGEKGLFREPA